MPSRVVRIKETSYSRKLLLIVLIVLVLINILVSLLVLRATIDLRSRATGMVPSAVIVDITQYPIQMGAKDNGQTQSAKSLFNSIICLVLYPLVQLDSCKK